MKLTAIRECEERLIGLGVDYDSMLHAERELLRGLVVVVRTAIPPAEFLWRSFYPEDAWNDAKADLFLL